MKKLFNLFLLSIIFQASFGQGTWTELNGLVGPQPASEIPHIRSDAAGFSVNGMICISTGYNFELNYAYNDIFGYNPSTNRWEQQTPMPTTGRVSARGGALNGKGFIALGYYGGSFLNDTWEFDPSTMSWTTKAAFPGTERQEAFSFVINNKFYIGGGVNNNLNTVYSDLWEYDPSNDSWTLKSSMPLGLLGSKTFEIENSGYVIGGLDSLFQPSTQCYKYDQLTDSWSTVTSCPGNNIVATMSDSLFGYAISDTVLYCYDPVGNSWTTKAPPPSSIYETISGKVNSLLYLISSDGSVLSYNPVADTWIENYSALGSNERPRIYGRSLVLSDTAYFNLIKYDINSDNWIADSTLNVNQWLYSIDSNLYAFRSGNYEKYNPVSRTWTSCSPCPVLSADYSFSTVVYGYILGWSTNSTLEFWQYDPNNDLWTIKSNFPGRNQGAGNSFGILNKGFIAGGVDSTSFGIDDFWEYDESTDTWVQRPSVPGGPRLGGCGISWNNKGVVAFGISDAVGFGLCDINVYDPTTSSWSLISHSLGCRSGNVIGFSNENNLFFGQGENRISMGVRDPYYDFWKFEDATSGITNLNSTEKFKVYPNPTTGSFRLERIQGEKVVGKVVLTDLSGRKVFQKTIDSKIIPLDITINVSPGMYLLNVYSGSELINFEKIIVQ